MQFSDLPANIVDRTKEVLLDSIGCALGGYVTERAKIAIQLSESLGVKPGGDHHRVQQGVLPERQLSERRIYYRTGL